MEPGPDELAGVADLFGGVTREELTGAFDDLAARSGEPWDPGAIESAIEAAIDGYYLVTVERDGRELLCAGPAALPTLPAGGDDLPHLLGVERRSIDPAELGESALSRLRGDAARAVNEGDAERTETLLSVCYDLEAWAPVETDGLRARLADALAGRSN